MGCVRAARGSGRLACARARVRGQRTTRFRASEPGAAGDLRGAGLTLGNDPVECAAAAGYRICESDAGTERVLSHDGLPAAQRIPLDFQLLLPPVPASGPDGLYPLVVFIHGWNGHKNSIGGGLESEFVPYAQAGYAVLAYSARAWGNSCGSTQQTAPECANQWNHLADVRFEVRDTQYFAGLLADELSDDGTPLVDGTKVGVTGVSYGGGLDPAREPAQSGGRFDGNVLPWTSPAGKPMQIAAAAPFWAWTDLSYSLLPNGRTLDYVSNNSYYGPNADHPIGVLKSSYVAGLRHRARQQRLRAARRGAAPGSLVPADQRRRAVYRIGCRRGRR